MISIREEIQEELDYYEGSYQLKSNEEIIEMIKDFGNGELEFHTTDINRLVVDNQRMEKLLRDLAKDYNKEKPTELYHISHIYNKTMTFLNSLIQ